MTRKMVVRADDVGYTPVNDIGAFESIEKGVVTAADVMLDCPGTVGALEKLHDMPWISVGWHPHFWGSPVLPPDKVPTLFNEKTGHFRTDIRTAADVSYNECLAEMYAQIERCWRVLGRVPDTAGDMDDSSPFNRAMAAVCDDTGIVHNFVTKEGRNGMIHPRQFQEAGIFTLNGGVAYADLETDSITEQEKNYDPYLYYAEDRGGMFKRWEEGYRVITQSWHPGYVDYYMYQLGDQGPRRNKFTVIRTKDVEALCSDRLKKWIIDRGIELVSFTDLRFPQAAPFRPQLRPLHSPGSHVLAAGTRGKQPLAIPSSGHHPPVVGTLVGSSLRVIPFFCLKSFPVSFLMSRLFASGMYS